MKSYIPHYEQPNNKPSKRMTLVSIAVMMTGVVFLAYIIQSLYSSEALTLFTRGNGDHQSLKTLVYTSTDGPTLVKELYPDNRSEYIDAPQKVSSDYDLDRFSQKMIETHDRIHWVEATTMSVEFVLSRKEKVLGIFPRTAVYRAQVVFDRDNGVEANIEPFSQEQTLSARHALARWEKEIEMKTHVPFATEITPRAQAYIIDAVVETVA